MPDFEIRPSTYTSLPELLVQTVPGFQDSPEYQLVAEHRDLPGVIVGALTPEGADLQAGLNPPGATT
jgi:hypothetical protein